VTRRPSRGSRVSPAVNPTAGADWPRPALGATTTRNHRSLSQGKTRLVAGSPFRGHLATPTVNQTAASGGPRHRPGVTASRTTPIAQPGRERDSPPAAQVAAQPIAAASQPRAIRPRAQAGRNPPRCNGDSEHTGRPVGGGSDPPSAAQPGLSARKGSLVRDVAAR
jgi:hypothetical protein